MIGAQHQDILADESVQAALEQGISKMARSYNETTLSQLKTVLNEKLTQPGGTNLAELTKAVDGVYSFADERRAGLIAKTESFRAANFANKDAWRRAASSRPSIGTQPRTTKSASSALPWTARKSTSTTISTMLATRSRQSGGKNDGGLWRHRSAAFHPDCRCYIRPEDISIE